MLLITAGRVSRVELAGLARQDTTESFVVEFGTLAADAF